MTPCSRKRDRIADDQRTHADALRHFGVPIHLEELEVMLEASLRVRRRDARGVRCLALRHKLLPGGAELRGQRRLVRLQCLDLRGAGGYL